MFAEQMRWARLRKSAMAEDFPNNTPSGGMGFQGVSLPVLIVLSEGILLVERVAHRRPKRDSGTGTREEAKEANRLFFWMLGLPAVLLRLRSTTSRERRGKVYSHLGQKYYEFGPESVRVGFARDESPRMMS